MPMGVGIFGAENSANGENFAKAKIKKYWTLIKNQKRLANEMQIDT